MDQCNQDKIKKLKKENRKLKKKLTLCQHLIERLQQVNEGYKKLINESSPPAIKLSEDDQSNTKNYGVVNSTRGKKRKRIQDGKMIDRRKLSPYSGKKLKTEPSLRLRQNTLEQLQSEENDIQVRLLDEGTVYSSSSATSSPFAFAKSVDDHVKNEGMANGAGTDQNGNTRTPYFIQRKINKQQRCGSVPEEHGKGGVREFFTSRGEGPLCIGETPKTDTSDRRESKYRAKNLRHKSGRKLKEKPRRHEHYHKYHGNMGKETPPGIWSLSPVDS